MASVRFYLDKRSLKKDGTYPLKLTVTHKKPFHISLDISIPEENWINNKIEGNIKNKKFLNSYISSRLACVENYLLTLKLQGTLDNLSSLDLKQRIENLNNPNKIDNEKEESKDNLLFKPYFLNYGNKLKSKRMYEDTVSKLSKFVDIDNLKFFDINRIWLKNIEALMSNDGLSVNTIGIYFRNIRTVFNDAINNELIDFAIYPFRRFSIKTEDTTPRTMSEEQLRYFRDFKCTKAQEKYRDLFMLSFYFRGLNLKDIVHLKYEDIYNGLVLIKRTKTNVPIEIKIEPEAQAIIDKYKGLNYLLNVMDSRSNYNNFLSYFNKIIKSIGIEKENGEIIKQPFKHLSIYWARHTWATLASELDIPDKIISIGLGHKEKQTMVDVYVKRNMNKVHDANRKIIDYLFQERD